MANEQIFIELKHLNNGWSFLITGGGGIFATYDEPEYYTTVSLALDAAKAIIAAEVTAHIT